MIHIPVLLKEVIQYFNPKPNQNFIDCTLGEGGHAEAILEKIGPQGKLLSIDWNKDSLDIARERLGKFQNRCIFVCDNFVNLKKIVHEHDFSTIFGILLDLGLSSLLLEKAEKGFSFKKDGFLDMRYGDIGLTAADIINTYSQKELARIFQEYGEERCAEHIAYKIVQARKTHKIDTTFKLNEIVFSAVPSFYKRRHIHPATKIFQALRITVNRELENLREVLPQAIEVLEPQGKMIVISYHSLEDRIVKNFFREESKKNILKIITKKPIIPTSQEILKNPRSRSAKMRVAEKCKV